jgi:hypothetical protein
VEQGGDRSVNGAWRPLTQPPGTHAAGGGTAIAAAQALRPKPTGSSAPASRAAGIFAARGFPLAVILAVQALLSIRLALSNTAFQDEAEYLLAGHLELAHLLHHTAVPAVFSRFFSGAPVVYPPLAAAADSFGGLIAARMLSLAFMLLATTLLHGVTRRLLADRLAACFAAALFGWLGPAQFLGAFATYDAMALMLLAVATWLGVRASQKSGAISYGLLALAGITMAVADAAKYAATAFDPIVIAVVGLAIWRLRGWRSGLPGAAFLSLMAAAPLGVAYKLAGPNYAAGIDATTLKRPNGGDTVGAVLNLSARGVAIVVALAVIGAIVMTASRREWTTTVLTWVLALAGLFAPAIEARSHTTVSLFKHLAFGGWFASAAAGYAVAACCLLLERSARVRSRRPPLGGYLAALAGGIVVIAGVFGASISYNQYHGWPNSKSMVAALEKLNHPRAFLLAEDYDVPAYYLRTQTPFPQWISMYYMGIWDVKTQKYLTGDPAYALAIQQKYYAAIVMNFADSYAMDEVILHDIHTYNTYYLYRTIHYTTAYGSGEYQIWAPSQ